MSQTEPKQNYLFLSIVIAGVLIALAIIYSSNKNSAKSNTPVAINGTTQAEAPQAAKIPQAKAVNIANVNITNEPFIGNPKAPVTLAYWLDFQCPFCRRFELQTLPTLISKYVKTGKLKIVFKSFQFLGPDSQTAGVVARAVWNLYPNSYFKWQTAMYNAQDEENSGFGNLSSILTLIRNKVPEINADKIAANVSKYRTKYQQEQDADKAEGSRFGINGTPGFVIGDQSLSGAQPASVFIQIINSELSKVK